MSLEALLFGGGAAGSIFSSIFGSNAAQSAASTQSNAAMQSASMLERMFQQSQANFSPYLRTGGEAANWLSRLSGTGKGGNPLTAFLTKPFEPTMAQLSATPGYQFALQQGELGVQNSFAAKGLGQSGAALKGAAGYAQGLASTTYQQQFQNDLATKAQIAGILGGQAGLGEQAALGAGQIGMGYGQDISQLLTGSAAAQAAGTVGSANALMGGIGNIANLSMLGGLWGMFGNKQQGTQQ